MALSLEQFQERLRVWNGRAAHEVENSAGTIAESWKGQQRVLGAVAMYMQGEGARYSPAQVRLRLITESETVRRAWEASKHEREVAFLAGQLAAYELILTLLKDAGASWS